MARGFQSVRNHNDCWTRHSPNSGMLEAQSVPMSDKASKVGLSGKRPHLMLRARDGWGLFQQAVHFS